jgi:hypothetical protein
MTDMLNNSTSNIVAQGQPQNSKQQYLRAVICRPHAVDNRDPRQFSAILYANQPFHTYLSIF